MSDSLTLLIGPLNLDPGESAHAVRAIQFTRANGAALTVDPALCSLDIWRERSATNGMEGVLGV